MLRPFAFSLYTDVHKRILHPIFQKMHFRRCVAFFFVFMYGLEIPASRVFLDADPQLLRISLAGARMPLSIVLSHFLNGI